jgi:hypothetical protein
LGCRCRLLRPLRMFSSWLSGRCRSSTSHGKRAPRRRENSVPQNSVPHLSARGGWAILRGVETAGRDRAVDRAVEIRRSESSGHGKQFHRYGCGVCRKSFGT